ncbi:MULTISPECIES: DUF84 family protein [Geobacillus]|mgnify:FL=1|jgi:inosine/xanthosine triphosphatase|uniref:Probable inosine/xanthosine triphosphatase n=4 Tax=Geobacillus thermodenitrificans TaxID=33940 RepID=A4IRW5_GEOTN|nr:MULTISPECIES: DUF84 family protein [Geobacillus]ABO68069.1 Conserved hypothetical protein [Geobacillus thermodenitrificans NG80-2]ARA98775.1 inosine/xanthosine triphosphatase [Geobacillus thermodenitrificans]ARP43832.1 putative non-canonical purine NTP phosphatase [Geobacillus thermodenitrificans]ATO38128.1 inosine/xanthosine triphosphatase [Geobacillus thermodenitrificans]KQB92226.1 NTPase [Geobacillus sp. PA-3]
MKTIAVGTKNEAKVAAVRAVFGGSQWRIVPIDVPSGVSAQPLSDEETRRGAIQRAKRALEAAEAEIGIGLEGGVMNMDGQWWLCNWGALVDRNGITVAAGGARLALPPDIGAGLEAGRELGELMEEYTGRRNIRTKEGAVGVFTNGRIDRAAMFSHIVQLLVGQYELFCQNGPFTV